MAFDLVRKARLGAGITTNSVRSQSKHLIHARRVSCSKFTNSLPLKWISNESWKKSRKCKKQAEKPWPVKSTVYIAKFVNQSELAYENFRSVPESYGPVIDQSQHSYHLCHIIKYSICRLQIISQISLAIFNGLKARIDLIDILTNEGYCVCLPVLLYEFYARFTVSQ